MAALAVFRQCRLKVRPPARPAPAPARLVSSGLRVRSRGFSSSRSSRRFQVHSIPCLEDNYAYLIEAQGGAVAVDPVDPERVMHNLKSLDTPLLAVMITHKHWDHVGGNEALSEAFPGLKIFGGLIDAPHIPAITDTVQHSDVLQLWPHQPSLRVKCLHTPCHTAGHIAFWVTDESGPSALFAGDTLFVGGCGAFLEGGAQDMYRALYSTIGTLPDDTEIFTGHEYTVANLEFATHVDPANQDAQKKLAWARDARAKGLSTHPSTMAEERRYNPFMRVHTEALASFAGFQPDADPVDVMAVVRDYKTKGTWKQ